MPAPLGTCISCLNLKKRIESISYQPNAFIFFLPMNLKKRIESHKDIFLLHHFEDLESQKENWKFLSIWKPKKFLNVSLNLKKRIESSQSPPWFWLPTFPNLKKRIESEKLKLHVFRYIKGISKRELKATSSWRGMFNFVTNLKKRIESPRVRASLTSDLLRISKRELKEM